MNYVIAAAAGIGTALILGVLFHLIGINGHGWALPILGVGGFVGWYVYKKLESYEKE